MEKARPYRKEDLPQVRQLIAQLGDKGHLVDFEEKVQVVEIRRNMRVWEQAGSLAAIAYIDPWNNLWYEIHPSARAQGEIESACIAWGVQSMRRENMRTGEHNTLDSTCTAADTRRVASLLRNGFIQGDERSLKYERSLELPLPEPVLPAGFIIRKTSPAEVEDLVELHRQAFGTQNMTMEERLAIMHAPNYIPALDLVVTAPDGSLAAFCIGGWEDEAHTTGYSDPIGTHPKYQRLGLARAVTLAVLRGLKTLGAKQASFGTSSHNLGMQALAEALGFTCVSEKFWFSKEIGT